MEQAATSGLTTLFAQLGVGGLMLAIIICGALWYLKASKELRDEKRDVISDLKAEIEKLATENKKLNSDLLDCQFPDRNRGVGDDRP